MKYLFWNTYRNKDINDIICDLVIENDISIVVLAEYAAKADELVTLLSDKGINIILWITGILCSVLAFLICLFVIIIPRFNNVKEIKIIIKKSKEQGKYRISVFNTGKKIDEENLNRIWTRFYKVDTARTRSKGGTGIGLALVKAIMTKYNNAYGVKNKKNGVEFYFDIQEAK